MRSSNDLYNKIYKLYEENLSDDFDENLKKLIEPAVEATLKAVVTVIITENKNNQLTKEEVRNIASDIYEKNRNSSNKK